MGQTRQIAPINININDLKDIVCECGNKVFHSVIQAKFIPALYSQNGQPGMLQRPCFMCTECGKTMPVDEMINGV